MRSTLTRSKHLVTALILCSFLANSNLFADESKADIEKAEEQAFKQASALVSQSVVRIDTVGGLDIVGKILTSTGPTTGVALTKDGYIVSSAFNFISKPTSVLVTLADGKRLPAKIVASDKLRMITLLKVDANNLIPPKVAKKADLQVGQWSLALGRTYDSPSPSMSVGIVSALNRVWGKAIQTDAKISPVNYGGPLVDVEGNVMGILVPISPRGTSETAGVEWYDSGIGFAIPLEDIYTRLDRLKEGKDIKPGLAGISLKGRDIYAGAPIIDRVRYDSPAWKAGLKPNDTIIEIEGQPVIRIAQVMQVLKSRLEGEQVKLKVKRGTQVIDGLLTMVGELLPWEPAFLGILPRRLADGEESEGVVVRHVFVGSPIEKAGVKRGDTIKKFNGQPVTDATNLWSSLSRVRPLAKAEIEYQSDDGKTKTVSVELSNMPTTVAEDLGSASIPGPKEVAEKDKPRTGRFTEKLPGYEQELWAYVPDSYNGSYKYGMVVFTHPSNDSMEATIFREWQSICELRGIILVAPKAAKLAGWTANETEYVKETIENFKERYNIDSNRVAIHGYGNGGTFAASAAFKLQEHIRGVILAGAAIRQAPPENGPESRLQFHLVCGDKDPQVITVRRTEAGLKRLKFPTSLRIIKDMPHKYPPSDAVKEMGRFLDSMDRI
jgi:serine protease Do